jgi:hypothetical protein
MGTEIFVSVIVRRVRLHDAAAGDELDDEHHNGDDQQQMDQTAGDMETKSEDPKNQENHKDRPEHAHTPFSLSESSGVCVAWMHVLREPRKGDGRFVVATVRRLAAG